MRAFSAYTPSQRARGRSSGHALYGSKAWLSKLVPIRILGLYGIRLAVEQERGEENLVHKSPISPKLELTAR
jgi:hypothetical protein